MRILHVINGLETGGAEKLITDTVPLLKKQGCEVEVLLLNGKDTPFKKLLQKNGIKIIALGNSYYNPLAILKMIPLLKNYDLVHAHLFPSFYFVALATFFSLKKPKLMFTEHNTSNRRLEQPVLFLLEKFIYSRYEKIICITQEVKNVLLEKLQIPSRKLVVIENGINLYEINAANAADRSHFGLSGKQKLIIMVAGFRHQKDHNTLLRALKLLPSNYKLLLVGDGDKRLEIEENIKKLGIEENVMLLGIRTDVYALIKMCDIAVLSSHWEGFGLAAAEAMACGTPTIASNVEGLAQVVNNGGLLFEKGNEDDLCKQILKLNDEVVRQNIAKNGLKKAEQYDLKNMVSKISTLYHEI